MKKPYTFRLDTTLVKQLQLFPGTRTHNITIAIDNYVHQSDNGNTSYVQHLEGEITYLRDQNKALMISSLPWYKRLLLKSNNP